MKQIIPSALLGALFAMGAVNAATTTPVGYYEYDGIAGNNIVVPALVNAPAYSGVITGSTATTLTVAGLTADAYNAGAVYPTHYVEITSGPNEGVVVDITSNTATTITLAKNISLLGLVGTESIKIRPHVTLSSYFSSSETLVPYSDTVTFYGAAVATGYFYIGDGDWSSDGGTPDGSDRPIPPGTGVVVTLDSNKTLTVVGEVKSTPTAVEIKAGVVNIVGATNPLVGDSVRLDELGFENMEAYSDTVTVYVQGGGLTSAVTYFSLGDGTVSSDGGTASDAGLDNVTGAVVSAGADFTLKVLPALP